MRFNLHAKEVLLSPVPIAKVLKLRQRESQRFLYGPISSIGTRINFRNMQRSVSLKMGIKEGQRALFVNAPADALAAMHLPSLAISKERKGMFDYIHLFVKSQAEFQQQFPALKANLAPDGKLWVSWPKRKQLNTDLSLPTVIKIGYDHGLVESVCLSVNELWSALKFTHPKKGKEYRNSYGKLTTPSTI